VRIHDRDGMERAVFSGIIRAVVWLGVAALAAYTAWWVLRVNAGAIR
jgi:hypothetical protein